MRATVVGWPSEAGQTYRKQTDTRSDVRNVSCSGQQWNSSPRIPRPYISITPSARSIAMRSLLFMAFLLAPLRQEVARVNLSTVRRREVGFVPAKQLPLGRIAVRSEGANQPSETQTDSPERTKLRVLIVDDNKAAATMLKMVVKMLGNEAETAGDGEEAIATAAEFAPHIVLMDLGMPKMNGYEAARHIRQQPWGQKMLLVALTGWGQDEDRQRTAAAGFDHHLVKPAEPNDLQQLFNSIEPSDA